MSMVGLDGGPPRSPLLPVVGDDLAVVQARLEAAGLL
jgi:hypothetical protein